MANAAELDMSAEEANELLKEIEHDDALRLGSPPPTRRRRFLEHELQTLVDAAATIPVKDEAFSADMPSPPYPHPDSLMLAIVVENSWKSVPDSLRTPEVKLAILHAAVHAWMEGHIDGETLCRGNCALPGDPLHEAHNARLRRSGGGRWFTAESAAGRMPNIPHLGARLIRPHAHRREE